MAGPVLAKTANRSLTGMMNEFTFLAGVRTPEERADLLGLALQPATTPCGPL